VREALALWLLVQSLANQSLMTACLLIFQIPGGRAERFHMGP